MLSINKKKLIVALRQKKQRDERSLFVVEGVKLVCDLLRGGLTPTYVAATTVALQTPSIRNLACEKAECTPKEIAEVSLRQSGQEMVAIFEKPTPKAIDKPADLVLLLDEIQDPGNLGTIIRIADWFGIHTIVASKTTADAFAPKVVQASMGAIARVSVVETDIVAYLAQNRNEWHLPVYGTFLEGGNIYSTNVSSPAIIVMGNEGNGISNAVKPFVSDKLFIPNFPAGEITSESLNVSAATAIVCSEFRRRNFQ
ncbi:MAG: RNA methyltransferase [Bacteroidales bacterium]|nr:RNA methyltransferase [Bacteroidales bacterium]